MKEPQTPRPNPSHYPAMDQWQSTKNAAAYVGTRQPGRFHRYEQEEAIMNHWLDTLPANALVLDIPCGTGRFVKTVIGHGFRYIGGDISQAMIDQARQVTDSPLVQPFLHADAAKLPLEDNSVDCVIVWRLLHHIRDEGARKAILAEACRVSRRAVILSFHHPCSFTALRKKLKRAVLGRGNGAEISVGRLRREAGERGLDLVETRGFRKYVSINWFALLQKRA